MGKTILTAYQQQLLDQAASDQVICSKYYLTGGTALSKFYLQHRLSYDIDLFTEKEEVDQRGVEGFLKRISKDFVFP